MIQVTTPAITDATTQPRIPQLDGLHALAVLGVLWHHSMPAAYIKILNLYTGVLGVQLFFVLSGFLITGILLDVSNRASLSREKWFGLRQFYARRFLRIFPLYYVVLLIAVLAKVQPLRDSWPWHAAYLSNLYFWRTGSMAGYGVHLWSLSVEEQFYVVWPLIILFMPRRLRLWSVLTMICVAPAFRLVMQLGHWGVNPELVAWLTPSNLDSLGVGALLAVANRDLVIAPSILAKVLLVFGLGGYLLNYLIGWASVLYPTFCASFFGWVIWKAGRGFDGRFGNFLQWKPLSYLGKISYGVYVIHPFALVFWFWVLYAAPIPGYRVFEHLHIPAEVYNHGLVNLLVMAVITISVASLSFRFFETPLNNLKKYFPYLQSPPIDAAGNLKINGDSYSSAVTDKV